MLVISSSFQSPRCLFRPHIRYFHHLHHANWHFLLELFQEVDLTSLQQLADVNRNTLPLHIWDIGQLAGLVNRVEVLPLIFDAFSGIFERVHESGFRP